jgi:O-acetyl-ADP-ribose deacetylase (regulator of RNase III)
MQVVTGNLLSIDRGIIVHGCNCLGVMGAGVARLIVDKYPEVYGAYISLYEEGKLQLGTIQICSGQEFHMNHHVDAICSTLPPSLIIVNAMTQLDVGTHKVQVDYDAISACFARVKLLARDTKLPVYFPLIGCGLAGGDWQEVAPRIDTALGPDIESILVKLPEPETKFKYISGKYKKV